MQVHVSPELQGKLETTAGAAARDTDELVHEVMAGYIDELAEVRNMLDRRYDIKSGSVKPIDGEEAFARLRRKSEERRAARS